MQIQASDNFKEITRQLDQANKSDELITTAFSQLLMSLRWASDPEDMIRLQESLNARPEETTWKSLCLAEKVSVLYRSRGIEETCKDIPALKASAAIVKRLKHYQQEVCSLTDGVVQSTKLTRYFTLRTLLLADTARLVSAEHQAKKTILLHHKGARPAKEALENLFSNLNRLFIAIDGHLSLDAENLPVPELCACLEECQDIVEAYKKTLSPVNDVGHKTRIARIDSMSKIMQLLQEAIQDPFCVFPLLMAPVQFQKEDPEPDEHLAARATEWLEAYLEVSTFQMRAYFQRVKFERIEKLSQEAFQQVKAIHSQVRAGINEIQAFLNLPGDVQRRKLDQFKGTLAKCGKCAQSLGKIEEATISMRAFLLATNNREKTLDRQQVIYPAYFHGILLDDLIKGLNDIKNQISLLHEQLPALLPEEFKSIDSPYVTCLDLLDFRSRLEFAKLMKKGIQEVEDPAARKLMDKFRKLLQSLFIKSRLQFMGLRIYFSFPVAADNQDIAATALDSKMLKIFNNPHTQPSVAYLEALGAFIQKLCTLRHWHGFMKTSPLAARQQSETSERRFFHELYKVLYQTLIEADVDFLFKTLEDQIEGPWMKSQDALYPLSKKAVIEIKIFFRKFQNHLKQRSVPPLKKFEDQAIETIYFIAEKMEAMDQQCDALFQALMDHLQLHPGQEENIDQFATVLKAAKEVWDPLILDSSNGLVRYLQASSYLKETPRAVKPKIVSKLPTLYVAASEPSSVTKPEKPLAPQPAKLPDTLPELLQAVEECCSKLAGCHIGFSTLTNNDGLQFVNQFSTANARNLIDTLASVKELSAYAHILGARPAFTAEVYLRLAILLEQALKLKASGIGLSLSDEDLKPLLLTKTGKECLWQTHSPLRIYQAFKLNFLSREQEEFLNTMARVIAISSRYPASGNDTLLQHVQGLLESDAGHDKTQKLLRSGLSTALDLLRSIPVDEKVEPYRVCLEIKKIEEALLSVPNKENPLTPDLLPNLLSIIKRLQLLRLAPQNRKVLPMAQDASSLQRSETIRAALADLSLIIQLSQDSLQMPENPGLCLTISHPLMRFEAAILESALLILISYLPIPSPEHPSIHYLWDASTPRRFSHRIDLFARQLVASGLMCARAQELTGYLKTGYRYPAEEPAPVISKLYTLSLLWEKMITGNLTDAESKTIERLLYIPNPDEREARLANHIEKTIQREIKQPFLETMTSVEELLTRYEKMLIEGRQ